MKKLLSLSAIVIIMMCLLSNLSIAAMQCNIVLDSSNTTEIKAGDELTVDVKVSDISSTRGLVSLGATLDYKKSSLKLEKIEGVGDYSTPAFNEANGKILIDREPTSHNATMFILKFTVLNTDNVTVSLNDISVSDGTGLGKVEDQSYTAKVKDDDNGNQDGDNQDGDNQGGDNQGGNNQGGNNQGGNNQGGSQNTGNINDTTVKDEKLPQTGAKNAVLPITAIIAVAIISFVKFRIINKNMGM